MNFFFRIFTLLFISSAALGQPGDTSDLICDEPQATGQSDYYLCSFPGESIYVPNNVPWSYPVSFLVPGFLPGDGSLRLLVHW